MQIKKSFMIIAESSADVFLLKRYIHTSVGFAGCWLHEFNEGGCGSGLCVDEDNAKEILEQLMTEDHNETERTLLSLLSSLSETDE